MLIIINSILITLMVLALFIVAYSFILVRIISKPKRYGLAECIEIEKSKNFWQQFDQYEKETWNILSFDGYELHGNLIKGSSDKFVIISHGYKYTRWGSVKYTHVYHKLGYNVYLYDLRHHGENSNCYCSMGDYESQDIVAIAKAIRMRFGKNALIGLHGESLGAASSLLAAGLNEEFSFVVADCGFSNLGKILEYQGAKKWYLPKFFVHTASLLNQLLHGRSFYDIQPIRSIENIRIPILFIHGDEDDFIPKSMSKDMFEVYKGPKQIELFPGARHAHSYKSNPPKYEKTIEMFCETNGLMEGIFPHL